MNKLMTTATLLALLLSTVSAGGGKGVASALSPIVPIETVNPSPWFIGAGLVWGKFYHEREECEYEDVTYGLMIRGGYEWNEYIGVEARAISTFWGEDELGGERLQHVGLFAKPSYPLGEDSNVYGLLGYGWSKTSTNSPYLIEVDETGFSWGIGFEYDFSDIDDDYIENGNYERAFDGQANQEKGWGFFIDYQRLLIKSGIPDMDVISVGLTYDF